jgi:predicted GIY-YIG superfamily endonuclease
VRLFLVDGNPAGLLTAEIMNWTGHVLAGPRSELPKLLARPEMERTGVYLLYGADIEDPDRSMLYIGESDQVKQRLKQHNQSESKPYWERTIVITSKDQNITKAHARYLEARLITLALRAGRARLENAITPDTISLPEADQSDMEFFIEQIQLILPVLGLTVMRPSPTASPELYASKTKAEARMSPIFELHRQKDEIYAQAREVAGEFVVLKHSRAVANWKQNTGGARSYAKLHRRLRAENQLQASPGDDLAVFVEDVVFSSPSAAAAVILGRSANGLTAWKTHGGQLTYGEWQAQRTLDTEMVEEVDLSGDE